MMTLTPTSPIPAANVAQRRCDFLTAICEQVQDYADGHGLYFDDEDRDHIDEALGALLEHLQVGCEPVTVAPRCRSWRVRYDEVRASGSGR